MIKTPGGHYLGCKPLNLTPHDLPYAYRAGTRLTGPSPDVTSNLNGLHMPGIFDQGDEGSCVMNGSTRWLYWAMRRFPELFGSFVPLSRQAGYYWGRALPWNNDTGQDSGLSVKDGFTVLRTIGACPEQDDPYRPETLFEDPGPKARADAACRKIGSQHLVLTVDDLIDLLDRGWCACIGMAVYQSMDEVGEDGIYDPDAGSESMLGLHDVFVHDKNSKINGGSICFDNSWGKGWGQNGSGYVSFDFLRSKESYFSCSTGAPNYELRRA